MALISIVLVLTAGLLLAQTFLRMDLNYRRDGQDDRVIIRVSWLGLTAYKTNIAAVDLQTKQAVYPSLRMQTDREEDTTNSHNLRNVLEIPLTRVIRHFYRMFWRFQPAFVYLAPRLRVERLTWHTCLGTGTVDRSGILTGLVWSIKGVIISWFTHITDFRARPHILVEPRFECPGFSTRLNCILAARLGHIIIAGLKALRPH